VDPSLLQPASGGARVLLLGDSLAQGLGPPLARLAEAAGVSLVAKGVQSSTIRQWLAGSSIVDAVTRSVPSLTLVCLGTNDMGAADAGAEGRRAGELVDVLYRNSGAAVAWLGPPSLPVDKSAFRGALAAACGERDVRIFDSQALDLARAPDGVHMTPAGYDAWAEAIAAWVPFVGLGSSTVPLRAELPTRHFELRDPIVVVGLGELALDDYVARVVTGELGNSRQIEALKAQAIAARTYLQRALHDAPSLGTAANPVRNGQDFQVAATRAMTLPSRAAQETRGGVAFYRGRLILANYVAGAPWSAGAWKGITSAKHPTEKYVTYNFARVGASVLPTHQADMRRSDNRGTLSQNGADALAARGWTWPRILRFFYGEDLEFTLPETADSIAPSSAPRLSAPKPSAPRPSRRPPAKEDADEGSLLLAASLAVFRLFG
jgi:stage II sporulation SpoD-like protein/GDSL-like lipase/acylhydrolase family protein